jgi:hypothetical protein
MVGSRRLPGRIDVFVPHWLRLRAPLGLPRLNVVS